MNLSVLWCLLNSKKLEPTKEYNGEAAVNCQRIPHKYTLRERIRKAVYEFQDAWFSNLKCALNKAGINCLNWDNNTYRDAVPPPVIITGEAHEWRKIGDNLWQNKLKPTILRDSTWYCWLDSAYLVHNSKYEILGTYNKPISFPFENNYEPSYFIKQGSLEHVVFLVKRFFNGS